MKETKDIEVVLQVKGNQKKLREKCVTLSRAITPHSQAVESGKRERNRIEKRTVAVFHKDTHDLGDTWNEHIQTVIRIERETTVFNTQTKQFERHEETAFYISTANEYSAKEFGAIIRAHWKIEHTNHYVRDVSLREDFSRIRKNPEHVAILRSFALNLLRINGETNVSQALYRNALNVSRMLQYIGVGR